MTETRFTAIIWPPILGTLCDCAEDFAGYTCTLDAGHVGPHAAHGADEAKPILTWSFRNDSSAVKSNIEHLLKMGEAHMKEDL